MPKKPFKNTTAITRRLQELDLSFEKGARYLASKGVEVSGSYLAMIAKGREPALPMARKIAEALEIKLSDVVKL